MSYKVLFLLWIQPAKKYDFKISNIKTKAMALLGKNI